MFIASSGQPILVLFAPFESNINKAILFNFFISFDPCFLKLQSFKHFARFSGHFLGNVAIDVNGKVTKQKLQLSCILDAPIINL